MRLAPAILILACAGAIFARDPKSIVLQDVRLIDGTGAPARDHVSILVRRGKITEIVTDSRTWPKGTQVQNLSGKTVMPGLVNGHGHLGLVKGTASGSGQYTKENVNSQLHQYAVYGVTTVMSLGMNKDLLYRIRKKQRSGHDPDTATILTADRGIGIPKGFPPVNVDADQIYRPSSPDKAQAAVNEMSKRHPDLIKLWIDDGLHKFPPPDPAVYTAAIEQAHRLGFRVAAHVYYLADADRLIDAGVDILAHSIRDKELTPELVDKIKAKNISYIATLQLEESFYGYADKPELRDDSFFQSALSPAQHDMFASNAYVDKVHSDPSTAIHRAALLTAMRNVDRLHRAGIPIAFGTDSGANPNRIAGWAEHRELQLLVASGLTPSEAIQSATSVTAQMLHIADHTGTIEVGKQADLLVLDADPTNNIMNTQKIAMVLLKGRVVHRP